MATNNPLASGLAAYASLQNMDYMKSLAQQANLKNQEEKAEQDLFSLVSLGIYENDPDSPGGMIKFTGDYQNMPKGLLSEILNSTLNENMLKYQGVIGKKKRKQGKVNSIERITPENFEQLEAPKEQIGNLKIILETENGRLVPMGRTAVEGESPENDLYLTDDEFANVMNIGGSTLWSKSKTGRAAIGGGVVAKHQYGMYEEGLVPGSLMPGTLTPKSQALSGAQQRVQRYDTILNALNNSENPEEQRMLYAALVEAGIREGAKAPEGGIVADNEGDNAKPTSNIKRSRNAAYEVDSESKKQREGLFKRGETDSDTGITYTDTVNLSPEIRRSDAKINRGYTRGLPMGREEAKEAQFERTTNLGTGNAKILDYEAQKRLLPKDKWLKNHVEKAIQEAEKKLSYGPDAPIATLPSMAPNTTAAKNLFKALGFPAKTQDITRENWETAYEYLKGMREEPLPSDAVDNIIKQNPGITEAGNTAPPALTEKEATQLREYLEDQKATDLAGIKALQLQMGKEKARAMNWMIASYAENPKEVFDSLSNYMATGDASYSQSQLLDDQYNQGMLNLTQSNAARGVINSYMSSAEKTTDLSWNENTGVFVDDKGEEVTVEQFAQRFLKLKREATARQVGQDPGVRNVLHTEAGRYFWALAKKYPSSVKNRLIAPQATLDKFRDDYLPEILGGNVDAWWSEGLEDPAKLMVIVKEGDNTRISFIAPGSDGSVKETSRSVDLNQLFSNPGQQNTVDPLLRDMGLKVWDRSIDPTGQTLVDGSAQLYRGFSN